MLNVEFGAWLEMSGGYSGPALEPGAAFEEATLSGVFSKMPNADLRTDIVREYSRRAAILREVETRRTEMRPWFRYTRQVTSPVHQPTRSLPGGVVDTSRVASLYAKIRSDSPELSMLETQAREARFHRFLISGRIQGLRRLIERINNELDG